jgi:hypothetical protein
MSSADPRLAAAGVEAVPLGRTRVPRTTGAPTRFFHAVVAATLPEAAGADAVRTERVVAFVHAQCGALPPTLRALLALGLFGFGALAWLRYARPFAALDAATQRRVVRAWSYQASKAGPRSGRKRSRAGQSGPYDHARTTRRCVAASSAANGRR